MNNQHRLDAIRDLGLQTLPHRDVFSHIIHLASIMLDCPIALLSVVEADRQWFLGRTGIDPSETVIKDSFCVFCVQSEKPLLIEDARTEPSLAANPLVTGAPFIRSYLGVPTRSDEGILLGALCAISPEPNAFRREHIVPLAMLDACGFTICLDDFGTGFSSLTHLRAFPIHKVKIDRDFIAAIAEDHQSRLIIQAIVQMGHSLGLRVVVERVETEEQEMFLRGIGCRHVQGYRYGRPALLGELQASFAALDTDEPRLRA